MRAFVMLLLVAAAAANANDESLFGWKNFHLKDQDTETGNAIRAFVEQNSFLIARENLKAQVEDVVVPPQSVEAFKSLLAEKGVQYDITVGDVGGFLLKERLENHQSSFTFNSDPSTYFARPDAIYTWLRQLVQQNPGFASLENIGKSHENRDLLILKLSTNPTANKPVIFVDSAIHAREWLAPATLNYIVNKFIAEKSQGQTRELLQKYDFYFMPVVNPDGYDYTFRSSRTRFWRKTRKPYGSYYGADPNRNFDFQFGGPSTSNNPASDIYHGPRPFSEPETLALSRFLTKIKSRLQKGMYMSFHTYGQMWLTPPGYTRVLPQDHQEMLRVANAGNNAIKATNGISFRVGQPANVGLYEAAGGSYDWVKFVLGVKYSYTLELRPAWPAGINGFVANVRDIPKSGSEIYNALRASCAVLP